MEKHRDNIEGQAFVDYAQIKATAPNLSALVGTSVAAKLLAKAGGLPALAMMDPEEIFCLGSNAKKKQNNIGSDVGKKKKKKKKKNNDLQNNIGYLRESEIYRATKNRTGTELASCAFSAALTDYEGRDPAGGIGLHLRDRILKLAPKKSKKKRNRARMNKEKDALAAAMMKGMSLSENPTKMLGPKNDAGKFKRKPKGNRPLNCLDDRVIVEYLFGSHNVMVD